MTAANTERFRAMPFAAVYPLYVAKVERKGRSRQDLDAVITWLTGYSTADVARLMGDGVSCGRFFDDAPFHANAHLITGRICGVRVEEIADPFMKRVRQLDKLVDEVANGRPLEKVLRAG